MIVKERKRLTERVRERDAADVLVCATDESVQRRVIEGMGMREEGKD